MEVNMTKLKQVLVEEKKFYLSLSFDIDDFIGDGIYWLQVYDQKMNELLDIPFASSLRLSKNWIKEAKNIVKNHQFQKKEEKFNILWGNRTSNA